MTKIFIKPYGQFRITGSDFVPIGNTDMRKIVFSPDNKFSISGVALRDGTLLLTNEGKVPFSFTIGRNGRTLAVVNYNGFPSLNINNNNWRLSIDGVTNREIHTNPDLIKSPHLNVDLNVDGLGRIDIKIDDTGFACCVFTDKDLLFVRMNGNHAVPRLNDFIQTEFDRSVPNDNQVKKFLRAKPEVKDKIGKKFFERWVLRHEWGLK